MNTTGAIDVGSHVTGVRFPHRTYRNRLRTATGRVTDVFPTAVRVQTEDGFFLVDRETAKEVDCG